FCFFQAEDGIRDATVTGVQTCALPILGVVDAHSHRVESVEEIAEGIRRTLQVIPAKQIFISPDCGLKTRMTEETVGKLRNMVEATKLVRNELTGSREHGNAATRVR